jgi:hypothetical protein
MSEVLESPLKLQAATFLLVPKTKRNGNLHIFSYILARKAETKCHALNWCVED